MAALKALEASFQIFAESFAYHGSCFKASSDILNALEAVVYTNSQLQTTSTRQDSEFSIL